MSLPTLARVCAALLISSIYRFVMLAQEKASGRPKSSSYSGAYQFYLQTETGQAKDSMRLVCLPNPSPSRNKAVAMFVEWAKPNPQYMHEAPVDTEFRFLSTKWPCKK